MSRAPKQLEPALLHADEQILVINKPAGYLCGPGNADYPGVPDAPWDLPDDEPFHATQRIDPNCSGAVVYARTLEARKHLETYQPKLLCDVLIEGYLEADTEITFPIFFDKRRGRIECSERRGTPARTLVTVLERIAGNTWCRCDVVAGKHEQIRPHLAAIAHPLTIDPHHGNVSPLLLSRFKSNYRPSRRHEERPLVARLTMHVAVQELTHPTTGETLRWEAPLAKDLRTTLRQLGRLT